LCAERVDYKSKSIAAIVISVEQYRNRVVVGKARIADEFARVDVRSIGIKRTNSEVDVPIIEENAHFCAFGGSRTFRGPLLEKIGCRLGQGPCGFIEKTVNP